VERVEYSGRAAVSFIKLCRGFLNDLTRFPHGRFNVTAALAQEFCRPMPRTDLPRACRIKLCRFDADTIHAQQILPHVGLRTILATIDQL
jgi:hypothetical protein